MKINITNDFGFDLCDSIDINHVITTDNLLFFSNGKESSLDYKETFEKIRNIIGNGLVFKKDNPLLTVKKISKRRISISYLDNEAESIHILFSLENNIYLCFYADEIAIEGDDVIFSFTSYKDFTEAYTSLSEYGIVDEYEDSDYYYINIYLKQNNKIHFHLESETGFNGTDIEEKLNESNTEKKLN